MRCTNNNVSFKKRSEHWVKYKTKKSTKLNKSEGLNLKIKKIHISQGRINKLKHVIKAALFEEKKITCNTYLVSKFKNISSKEVEVV